MGSDTSRKHEGKQPMMSENNAPCEIKPIQIQINNIDVESLFTKNDHFVKNGGSVSYNLDKIGASKMQHI